MKIRFLGVLMFSLISSCQTTPSFDYSDFSEKRYISWEDMFLFDGCYYVYIFSKTCSHCEKIKQQVLAFLVKEDCFYLIEGNKDIPRTNHPEENIGETRMENVAILGYPTLFLLENKAIKQVWTGEYEITSYII